MTVTIRLFASYADKLGRSAFEIECADGSTVADIVRSVASLPGGSSLPTVPLVAVNRVYADSGAPVTDGDEVAIIPPVAGG